MRNVIVTTMANWVHEEMRSGLSADDFTVVKDYGFDIPLPLDEVYAWWMPAAHAARVKNVAPNLHMVAPGVDWLPSLPFEFVGRSTATMPLAVLHEGGDGEIAFWMKPAEAKIEEFPAGMWNVSDVRNITANMSQDMAIQVQVGRVSFDHEHRFYVVNDEILTGSPYLDGGVTWNDGIGWDRYDEAKGFASMIVRELEGNQPPSYVLDVGWDKVSSKWLIVEGNPTWCSGFYGSDISLVVDAIHESMIKNDVWAWTPDPELVRVADRKKELVFAP